MNYTHNLRLLRESADMSQTQVAAILGIQQKVYSRYETGINELPLRRLLALCRFYQVSADYILGLPKGYLYGIPHK